MPCSWAWTPNEVLEENVNKLKSRYPGGEFDVHYSARIEKKAISKLLPILTDVDGVLLEWEPAFTKWMNSKGYEVKDRRTVQAV